MRISFTHIPDVAVEKDGINWTDRRAEVELAKGTRISSFKQVMPKTHSDEFRIEGAGQEPTDAALHESMLENEEAEAMADIAAVKQAIASGVPVELAVRLLAGDLARSRLIAAGLLSEGSNCGW